MKNIAVCVVSLLCYASVVPIRAEMSEITEARIAGEKDAEGFHWKWFAVGNLIIQATPVVLFYMEEFGLFDPVTQYTSYFLSGATYRNQKMPPVCCLAIYGAYALSPTVFALRYSPAPPADRLLGKSPDWIDAYTHAYQKHVKRHNAASSAVGCFVGGASLLSAAYVFGLIRMSTDGVDLH